MNTHIEEYLDTVCRQIKCKQVHSSIREELAGHIGELQEAYMSQGDDEEIATEKALAQMGDAQEVGQKLHKTHKPQTDWVVLGILALLLTFGVSVLAQHQVYLSYHIATRQTIFIAMGLCIAALLYFTDYSRLFRYSFLLYGAAILLNVYLLLFSGDSLHYLRIGIPVDGGAILLFCYLLSLAGLAIHWRTEHKGDSYKLIAAMGLAMILLLNANLPKAFILGAACLPLLHYSVSHAAWCTNPKKQLAAFYSILAAFFLAGFFTLMAANPYYWHRLTAYTHPENDPKGSGYITIVQRTVMENTSLFHGMPEDIAVYQTEKGPRFILPDAHTDLIFTCILGRFGWGVAIGLCLAMAILLGKMFLLSRKITDGYGKALCYGITAFFAAQTIYHVLMNLTILPLAGISLPFISYGGSMMLLDMALMAIFLNVYRRKNLIHETASLPDKKRLLPHVEVKVTWK